MKTILLALLLSAPIQASKGTVVLKGATVIDGLGGEPVADAVVVIEGDTISSISGAGFPHPVDAGVVDLAGSFIIPGLIDSHVHWEEWMGELYLNHGVTSVVALRNIPRRHRELSHASEDLPRLFHSGNRPRLSPSMSREQVRASVRRWLENEPDMAHFPTFNDRISRVYRWAAEEVRREGFLIFGHAENAPAAIEAGLDVVEHVWGFTQAQMSDAELEQFQEGRHLTWATFMKDWPSLDAMIRDAVRRGVYLNPTLLYEWGGMSAQAARHELEDYQLLNHPDLSYFPAGIAASLLLKHRQIKNFSSRYEIMPVVSQLPPGDEVTFREGYRRVQEFVRRWAAAGGGIQAGTDAPSGGTPGLALHHEMEMLVEAGLTPCQALQAATLWSARLLAGRNGARGDPRVGSLRPGSRADLVVLEADPLADISNVRKIRRVMKGGRFLEPGYRPDYFTFTSAPRSISGATPVPRISSIAPSAVVEGSPELEVAIEGVGFTGRSVVAVDGVRMPTRFLGPRRLAVQVPASLLARAAPNPFSPPGPAQKTGVYGDRTISIAVFNPPPEGGLSNPVYLVVRAKWQEDGE